MLLEPFTGFVPTSEFAHRIVGPPVSMLSPDQREEARTDPLSFRHVVGRGAGSSNAEAREWLRACDENGALHPMGPMVAVYQLAKGDLVANVCHASRKDLRNAVGAARGAFPAWRARAAFNRGQILYRIGEMLEGRREQFEAELRAVGATPKSAEKEIAACIRGATGHG